MVTSAFHPLRTLPDREKNFCVAKNAVPAMSALTKALMIVYVTSAAAFALMLLWLMLKLVRDGAAAEWFVIPPAPGFLLFPACLLMLAAKIAGGWAYKRDVGAAER